VIWSVGARERAQASGNRTRRGERRQRLRTQSPVPEPKVPGMRYQAERGTLARATSNRLDAFAVNRAWGPGRLAVTSSSRPLV
jgi:hypothetical protein